MDEYAASDDVEGSEPAVGWAEAERGDAAADPDLSELEMLERRLRDLEQELANSEIGERGTR